jgi:drug/metabolite transporter (DMT)-like permease
MKGSTMGGERGRILLIMLAAVLALTLGETALAKGMKQAARVGGDWPFQALAMVRNGWIVAGVVLLGLHLLLYLLALRRADLSFALPLTAASYPLSALMARFYLREDVGSSRWIGTLLITAGVAIVALSEVASDR